MVLTLLAITALALYFWRQDKGLPHDEYFQNLQTELKHQPYSRPTMLVDLDIVDMNIETVRRCISDTSNIRIVAKSLPCPELLEYLQKQLNTNRLMIFHQPYLNQLVKHFPDGDFLVGKPMPVRAVEAFLNNLQGDQQKTIGQVQWLIDSYERLEQYLALAKERQLIFKINIEIDVGLHRGGIGSTNECYPLLHLIRANIEHFQFSGFMGYEPHLAKSPLKAIREKERRKALDAYNCFISVVRTDFPELYNEELCFNAAGSMTYQLYPEQDRGAVNELSIGSAFVKPSDFDLTTLSGHTPALFIATPILKRMSGLKLPFLEKLSLGLSPFCPNYQQSYFLYGGWWKARVYSPKGLAPNSIYGRSTNQEMVCGSNKTGLNVDDYIFLRPTQSESVMLQFGKLRCVRNGTLESEWSAFTQDY